MPDPDGRPMTMPDQRVYVVMVNDRHTDPEPFVFSTEDAAVAFARETARDWLVELLGAAEGWLYYAKHPTESDEIWVVAKTLDGDHA